MRAVQSCHSVSVMTNLSVSLCVCVCAQTHSFPALPPPLSPSISILPLHVMHPSSFHSVILPDHFPPLRGCLSAFRCLSARSHHRSGKAKQLRLGVRWICLTWINTGTIYQSIKRPTTPVLLQSTRHIHLSAHACIELLFIYSIYRFAHSSIYLLIHEC